MEGIEPQRRFAILDRDGTIIVERHYLSDPDLVELLPGAAQGLRQMRELGLGLVVVTNQSPIGRGYFGLERLEKIHQRMRDLLAEEGIQLDGIYFCPHRPDEHCACRKPETGMLDQAAEELGFDKQASFVVGDKPCDIELGQRVGAATFLVRTGYGDEVVSAQSASPDYVVNDLWQAAKAISSLLQGNGRLRKNVN